jgi:hypothetical protein
MFLVKQRNRDVYPILRNGFIFHMNSTGLSAFPNIYVPLVTKFSFSARGNQYRNVSMSVLGAFSDNTKIREVLGRTELLLTVYMTRTAQEMRKLGEREHRRPVP